MGTKEGMTVRAKESLKGCDCMIGAKRLLEVVEMLKNVLLQKKPSKMNRNPP